MRIIILILLAFLLIGCKAKTNTVYKSEVIKITPASLNSIKVESPCDSLGNLKPINYTFTTGKTKTVLKTIKDTLYLFQTNDSIVEKTVIEKRETIKYKTPKWAWWSLICLAGLTAFTFRRFLL